MLSKYITYVIYNAMSYIFNYIYITTYNTFWKNTKHFYKLHLLKVK